MKEIIYTKDGKRYEQKPWPKLITVKTHHNGYAVRIGDNEYMYLDVPGLIKGLAVHSGFEDIGFLSYEELDRFLESVCNGQALQKALTEIVELKRVKPCCASCFYRNLTQEDRVCRLNGMTVDSGYCCSDWEMDERLNNAGKATGVVRDIVTKEVILR